MKLKKGFKRV